MPIKPRALVPLVHVADVGRSIRFYEKMGFVARNTFVPQGRSEPAWAEVEADGARLMLGLAEGPVVSRALGVLFYLYCDDVAGARATLLERGVEAGPIAFPFYAPRGEFRVTDPDGYAILVTHT